MSEFISYAQNYEDVVLWRALKHLESGFYIDVGAWSPDVDSVTKAFYDRGWRGINVEPNPEFIALYETARERDINLAIAISDYEGSVSINILENPGLSTVDPVVLRHHASSGLQSRELMVPVQTLKTIWELHVPEQQDVHFLKVDVEGLEGQVIKGNDWQRNRPWVVVVESTLPMSQEESHADWEPLLLQSDYVFAYADGLNRFYVAREHGELLAHFKYPPNHFDHFMIQAHHEANVNWAQAVAQVEAISLEAEAVVANAELRVADEHVRADAKVNAALAERDEAVRQRLKAEEEARLAHEELARVLSSNSWKMTEPLRSLGRKVRGLRGNA